MLQKSEIKVFLHKLLFKCSPLYRKVVKQDKNLSQMKKNISILENHILETLKTQVDLKNSISDIENYMGSIGNSIDEIQNNMGNIKNSVNDIDKKVKNQFYNKSEYFEINSELGVFTIPDFKRYIQNNKNTIDKDISILKESLDDESKDTIDLFLERIQYFLPEKLPGNTPVLYKKDALFSQRELTPYVTGKVAAKAKAFRKKYEIGNKKTFLCPIYYESGLYFLNDTVKEQIKDSIVVDCGAYWGDTAIVFSEYSPRKVYAFEPVDYWHDEMVRIVQDNKLDETIVPVKMGISDQNSELYYTESDTTSFLSEDDGGISCAVTSIDSFLSKEEKGRVGLIKYDVEGLDFLALKGSLEVIKRDKPILLTSIYHEPEHFLQIKPFIDDLNLGYKHIIRKLAKSPLCDVMLISWVDK